MKKLYVSPEIELDNFTLIDTLCADLYGGRSGGSSEFYAIGDGNGNVSPVPEATSPSPGRPGRG